jgi:hypothetical protein
MKPVVAHFRSEPLVVALATVVVLACGCVMIPKQRGDALVIDRKSFLLPPVDDLLFPWMDLSGARTYYFEARGLPWAVYPDRLDLTYRAQGRPRPKALQNSANVEPIMSGEELERVDQPWRQVSLRIQFKTTNGHTFLDRTIRLHPQPGGPHYDERRRTAVLQFLEESVRHSLLQVTNYDVMVDVMAPAEKSPIEARLFAETSIYW